MNNDVEAGRQSVNKVGYWSALFATIFSISFVATAFIGAALSPTGPWRGVKDYASRFESIQMLPDIPSFFLAFVVVAMMAAIYSFSSHEQRIFGLLGLVLAVSYMTIVSINYYTQLTVVRQNLLNGNTEGLALFAMTNPDSLFFALEGIGYGLLGVATLAAAPVFARDRKLDRWIKYLFALNGVLTIAGIIGQVAFSSVLVIFVVLGLWSILFPVSTALVAILFKRETKSI